MQLCLPFSTVRLPPLHTLAIYPCYYIGRTHPVIIQSDNNTVETCLKACGGKGNLPDCLFLPVWAPTTKTGFV